MRAVQEIFQYNFIEKGQLSLTEISHKKKEESFKESIFSVPQWTFFCHFTLYLMFRITMCDVGYAGLITCYSQLFYQVYKSEQFKCNMEDSVLVYGTNSVEQG